MNLGIFTSCYGEEYAQFLPRWERTLAQLHPPLAGMVVVGDEHAQRAHQGHARFIYAPQHGDPYRQGPAHDQAARTLGTEWAMHLGVDDLPTWNLTLDLKTALARKPNVAADVIAVDVLQWENGHQVGLRKNRPTRELILTPTMGRQPLDACAAFRTEWLERVSYRDWDGGVDVALWVDMARLGATFAWTGQPGVVYCLRPTSLWHCRSRENVAAIRRRLNELRQQPT